MNHDYFFIQKKADAHFFPNIYVIGKIYADSMKKVLGGVTLGPTLAMIEDGVMYWYASEKCLASASARVLKMMQSDPMLVARLRKKFVQLAPRMLAFTKKIHTIDLSKLSNRQLWLLLDKYLKNYEYIYNWSEPVVLCLNDSLGAYLKNYLHKLVPENEKATQYCNLLISPREPSFVKREEDALLRLALDIKNKKIFDRAAAVRRHVQKYCWVPYDYGVYIWDAKYFNKILDETVKERADIAGDLKNGRDYSTALPRIQEKLIKTLGIDKYHAQLFAAMRDAAYLLDYKKEIFTQAHWHVVKLLEEIGRRLGVPRLLVHYYLPVEIQKALCADKPLPKNKLESRYKYSLAVWDGAKAELIEGAVGKRFLDEHLKQQAGPSKVLNGVIASAGRYRGTVKVLRNAREVGKVKAGDILVAAMTSPEYVPAMRKAGAVITDEGGVMCHAAIVSRELGIPCVVGTKNATKILKDGDMVEVNANHNSVKILVE